MNKKKIGNKITILLIFVAVSSILLFFGYRTAKAKVFFFLSNPIDLGEVQIVPQKFQMSFPFKFSWESINIAINGVDLFFKNPKILLDPMLGYRRELLNISIDSVYAGINPEMFTDSSESNLESISHPDLWLPFRLSMKVNKAAIDVKNVGSWGLDSLIAVKSGRQKRFYIIAKDIKGTHLARNLFLNADYSWNELFSDASISISDRTSDSIAFVLNAPREKLENLSANIKADIESLPFWLNDKWPSKAPEIKRIALRSNLSYNILTNKIDFNLDLKTKIGELWQLPAFDATVTAFGSGLNIAQSEISLKGKDGESIRFKGSIDRNLDGNGELEVKGINITLGPETLPTDVKFHRITKKGNSISTDFTTGAGSNFTAKMADLDKPVIVFSADLAPKEPWAVQWTGDMVKLANPTILTGSFSFEEILLKANLKTKVPFAYYAAADELDVSLWLDPDGIHFPKGTIKRNGYESAFTGEVVWSEEYFTFKLNQQNDGKAEVYGKFSPRIDLSLQDLNTLELPFADTAMLKGYNGFVSGNWNHDFNNKKGNASVSLSTVIKDLAINAKADIGIFGDSMIVKNFEVEQEKKKIIGYLFARLPTEAEKNIEILQAGINIPNMNLVSLLAAFKDSTLLSGYANGNLEYSKKEGLAGELILSKIVPRGLDSNIMSFSDFRVKAFGQSANVFVRVFLGDGLWNGNLEAGIDKIGQKSDLPMFLTYSADNIGNVGSLRFDGFLSRDLEKIFGSIQVLGDWFLPNGIGEIKKANINISARTILGKNALDSLTAKFNTGQNIYEFGIFKIPFEFSGQIRRGVLLADSIFVHGQNNEKIAAKLQFDLNNVILKDLSFNTELFTLFLLNEHWIKIKNGIGSTRLDNDGITIFAELPSISYRMESIDYGTVIANLKGQAAYRFPFHTGQSQTNPSITGNFEIGRASYKNTIELIPDPMHLDKTFKTIGKFFESLFKEKRVSATEMQALKGRPTTLNIKIQTGREEATVSSNLAEFAFGVNLTAQGTTKNILLSGDINAIGNGKIGYNGLTMFDMSFFRLYWQDSPIKNGKIELRAYNDYPLCSTTDESCTIFIDIDGQLTRLSMQPTTNCNIEASPALIYYSMLLGCVSTADYESGGFDFSKFRNKVFGKAMSSLGNKALGTDVIGDVDLKWSISKFNDIPQEQDTNYIRVPISVSKWLSSFKKVPASVSKWVSNLEVVLGYTNDISLDPRYYESYELGLRYSLPVFDPNEINSNFIDPSLDISTNLVMRSYQSKMESGQDEARLEKNVGLVYRHKFWDPCILGIGWCKVRETSINEKESITEEFVN
jgi:hypothetical protein